MVSALGQGYFSNNLINMYETHTSVLTDEGVPALDVPPGGDAHTAQRVGHTQLVPVVALALGHRLADSLHHAHVEPRGDDPC